jgi:hypothetical protein
VLATALLLGPAGRSSGAPTPLEKPRVPVGGLKNVPSALIASPLASPHPVIAADGKRHLVYELQLINPTDLSVTVTGVRTVDPATGRLLATIDASTVASLMTPFGMRGPGPTLRPGGAGSS